jgi:hypothetical protein
MPAGYRPPGIFIDVDMSAVASIVLIIPRLATGVRVVPVLVWLALWQVFRPVR